ncbi:MAG: efflux RND transporter periplasmic adaptor subunit [Candidatus Parcubacteria bacterium]|nr:efflux RND transporter periplasmic adaptor subunit [Candidatus Parcubacteria bacterium]
MILVNSQTHIGRLSSYLVKRKKLLIILLIILAVGGYFIYKAIANNKQETRYTLTQVAKGTIISSISGSGQVSASNQIDITSKVSGDLIYLSISEGQEVKAGTLIAQISSLDAQIGLENAKISLEKLTQPADALSILQAENALEDAKQTNKNAQEDLIQAYEDGYNTVANAFLDVPDIVIGLNDIFYSATGYLFGQKIQYLSDTIREYSRTAEINYGIARKKYDLNLVDYKNTTRSSDNKTIESLITNTYDMMKAVSQAVKDTKNTVDYMKDQASVTTRSDANASQTNLTSWTTKANSSLNSLLSAKNNIANLKNSIIVSERDIRVKNESLLELKSGADPLDIRSQELALKQKQNAYQDYFIYAPFDGIVAKLNVKKSVSISGSTVIATLITKQKVAEISLNEIDAAKVKIGQKATLTFDAIEGLSISGEVISVDMMGTVSQGVVSYSVKIGFDSQDDRVKSGMSVSAAVIIDIRQDVLTVSNNAIKSEGDIYYVEKFNQVISDTNNSQGVTSDTLPEQITVEVGLADDTSTEILSGLKEGDQIILKTTTSKSSTTRTSTPSLFGAGGGMRTGGGDMRPSGGNNFPH